MNGEKAPYGVVSYDGIDLYHGECLAVMDELIQRGVKVNAIITDPPYGMSYQSGWRKEKHKKIQNDDNLSWLPEFVDRCYALANDNTAHYIFCSFHCIDKFKYEFEKKFTIKNILVWQKNNHTSGDLTGNFANKVEFILFMHKGRRLINGKRDANILNFNKTLNNFHPTEKPVDLMEYLMHKFSDVSDTIFDPFMGSGTTCVAAYNTGRKCIGIEMDDKYFEVAKQRVLDAINAKAAQLF